VSLVARQHGLTAAQLFQWRKAYLEGSLVAVGANETVVPASELQEAMRRIKQLEGALGLEVPDDRLDRLASFEQPAFFIGQPLVLAPVFDLNARVLLVHAPVAQVGIHHLGLDAQALHQDGALLNLLVHRVTVIWVTGKAPCTHDQIALERHGQTDLDTKLVRVAAFALADALYLWRVPVLELGAIVRRFAATGLSDQAFALSKVWPNVSCTAWLSVVILRATSRCKRQTMVRWRLMTLRMRLNWRAWA
jgi:hypothetical protein